MDSGVEMVEDNGFGQRAVDGIIPADEYEMTSSGPGGLHYVRRQNRWFGSAIVCLLLTFAVYLVTRVYTSGGELPLSETVYDPTSGIADGCSGDTEPGQLMDPYHTEFIRDQFREWAANKNGTTFSEWLEAHPEDERKPPVPKVDDSTDHNRPYKNADEESWHTTTVSLADGIMYEVIKVIEHDYQAFTEGLAFADGMLYESTGMNGKSTVRTLNQFTGEVVESYDMDSQYFGEGLTFRDGKLIQLTYKKNIGFIYDPSNLTEPIGNFTYQTTTGEGWGLTYDDYNDELIVSDGSPNLLFWDPETFEQKRKLLVRRQNGKLAANINELEFWRGRVLANIWFEDTIVVINPKTGVIEKEYDFSQLWPKEERKERRANVLNGISIGYDPRILYVTGKYWDRMFIVRLLAEKPHC